MAIRVLDEQLPPLNRTEAAVKLLSGWAIEAEQLTDAEVELNVAVLRAIDRDRLSERKLFTEILDEHPR